VRRLCGGPGVTSPKSRPSGCRADHAGNESFPSVFRTHFSPNVVDQLDGELETHVLDRSSRLETLEEPVGIRNVEFLGNFRRR
jgi:hypothetical protein